MPSEFAGLKQAGNALESILSPWLRNWQTVTNDGAQRPTREHLYLVKYEYGHKLLQWRVAFNEYCARRAQSNRPQGAAESMVLCLVQLHYTLMYIQADIDHEAASMDEMLWDAYMAEFQLMVKYGTGILNPRGGTLPEPSKQTTSKPLFSLDNGILAPLSFIASRCRDPEIRRAAISLIRIANRKEGFWTSDAAAMRSQTMVEIEETEMELDYLEGKLVIPKTKRVVGAIEVVGVEGTKAACYYVRPPPVGEEESLRWGVRYEALQ
jgi:hypothetical protein